MSVDVIIVFSYLILTLAYGLYVGRGVKNISEYAIGNRDFTTPILAATIIATYASSSGFFINITKSYADGFYKLFATSGLIFFMFFTAYFIAPRMKPFFGKLSIPEILGSIYGKNIRILSSIPVIIISSAFVAIQIKVLSTTITHFSGIDPQITVLFTALIIVIYSAFGGIRAVTLTDFIQFGTFMVAVPLLYAFFWWQLELPQNTSNRDALISHLFYFDENKFNYYMMIFLYFMISTLYAPDVQRMLMARDTEQITKSYSIAAKLLLGLLFLISMIGALVYVINPNLEEKQVLPFIMEKLTMPGLKGALFTGILAMSMSTADSNLNSGAVSFAHDFCRPIGLFKQVNELKIARAFSFVCGFLAIIFALKFQDIIDLLLLVGSVYAPVVSVPLLFAIFGFRSSTRAVSVGIVFGVVTVLFWKYISPIFGLDQSVSAFLPGIVAHMIGLFGTHYLLGEPGGWTGGPSNGGPNSSRSGQDGQSSGHSGPGRGVSAALGGTGTGNTNPGSSTSNSSIRSNTCNTDLGNIPGARENISSPGSSTSSYLIQNPTIWWGYIKQFSGAKKHTTSKIF